MKLLLLHGPAITSSRKKLINIKEKFSPNDVVIFEKGADPEDVLAVLQTVSMFEENRLVILENPPDDFISDPSLILYNTSLIVVFWFDHEVKKLPDGKEWEILFFPEAKEVSVFPFLDLLANKNPKAFLELDKLKKGGRDIQYVITMLFYLLRSLAITPKNAPEFVKRKLAKQRENFPLEKVKDLYKFVIETDFKIKKGLMGVDQVEFLLVNRFIDS
ncbi:hypothetical protein A3F00_03575 [Candidatus Daviesbacteria bacterium RIFCSPHIGHO2_12_FULL_37_11]|uniref:DNA polymerase III delta N-terminal domain-containing protein n=1 Tax=Candidatus Daviesbacteria bacterium RIFCSPHIGHO2_12_FULL_37_11 TaxID=1797777 RepID=A0A1F5KCP8_9BACT|nr:MAG: hypothetical protein A2111_02760 [Candidatus Daviesbacteria bacterium GWA1_38_6]OGE18006.1 MAG: hypothetical protein A2769_01065 [Candidatus Daviesbacteria bacterium RIFCSPHIGHO2_01_FULL_37_27]OGE38722.1 MAG: hypothetical protein A3F00_03575 [Candidatus Daviesbacteria bacterium RIFCSPHIGHO2_12_FULL_37_11]OGE45811.1 MAG: hypothetical protein A3B39_01115 [Candidatus Daviesbacteria bacterium RIFCSPLOWO2_01_FULL_37_10]